MKEKPRFGVGILFVGGLVFALCGVAGTGPQIKKAPLNSEFVEFVKEAKSGGKSGMKSDDGHFLGDCPSPMDLGGARPPTAKKGKTYPATYDLRTLGKVTPVRDQGAYGTCWTFGTLGSLESNLMPMLPNPDLSENNIANYAGFDPNFNGGGSTYMSAAYLARWAGPYSETDDPYPVPGYLPPLDTALQYHVQAIIFAPARASATDNDIIKGLLTTFGACSLSFYYKSACYNSSNFAFYNGEDKKSNHAVTLVGWDDNFPAENFNTAPPGNGAFLIKNSWGTSWGDQGYFWISYYDTSIRRITCFCGIEPVDNFTGICQYDELGAVGSFGNNSDTFWGANIFTAGSSDPVSAVSTWAVSSDCEYEISIYTGVTAGNPVSGTLAGTETGSIDLPGYYTILLGAPVAVVEGEMFSVVVKYRTPGYNYPLPYEYAEPDYTSAAVALPGQSFYSGDGTSWTDFQEQDKTANACIKAFGPASARGQTGIGVHATIGSEFYMQPTGRQFEAKPTCYVSGGGLGTKKKTLKVMKGTKPEYPASAVRCQWTSKLGADMYGLYVQEKVKGEKPDPSLVSNGFFIELPEGTSMSTSVTDELRQISLVGLNFGVKKPKLYFKYTLDGKDKKLSCKIVEYGPNAVEATVKEASLQKLRDKGVASFFLQLENAIGKDAYTWEIH